MRLYQVHEREDGQGLLEYALILGFVSIAAVAALILLGGAVVGFFDTAPGWFTP